jgi:AraC family transcriptional regulator of adaptative response/methylated-DNA-[protein]-cysteine methyltransferase
VDGAFYYSVTTTGVYCRPSCPSRRPNPEHVRFHATAADAERAGFRPCRRCRPERPAAEVRHAAAIVEACRVIDAAERPPSLEALAKHAGLSPYHFHRVFRETTGVTPRAYALAARTRRMAEALEGSRTVTDAIYGSGFNSSGRFYEASGRLLGMTPTAYRAGGADVEIRFAFGKCSLGLCLVAQSAKGVCAILLGELPEVLLSDLRRRFPRATLVGGDEAFERIVAQVVGLVEEPASGIELPLDLRGTAFQRRVWQALREIPPGRTASYTDIAGRIGAPRSVRAVAGACAANPLAVAVPCHRVVRSDGSLSGYRWGIERKRRLLERERARSRG